jgi:hypothetical protein
MAAKQMPSGTRMLEAALGNLGDISKGERKQRAVAQDSESHGAPAPSETSQRYSITLPLSVLDAFKNAVIALSGPPLFLSVSDAGTQAIQQFTAALERDYNEGKPFPKRAREPRPGPRPQPIP